MQVNHFTLAYGCILLAAVLPMACSILAKWGMFKVPRREGGYDNNHPRAWLAKQTDWRARANAAQANTFEALPFFMAAVIVAHQLGAHQGRLDLLAFMFVVLRILYIMVYVGNMATIRSAVWGLAFAVNVFIFLLGYR